jgi:hypothetical protein
MKKLFVLHFRFLTFAAHFDWFEKLSALLAGGSDTLKTAVAPFMPNFNAWLAKEDALMQWVRKSALTEQIAEADQQVDRVLVGINAGVELGRHSSVAVIAASAERVHIMLKNYGDVAHESYDDEAGDVRSLLEQFGSTYIQDMSNLSLIAWVQELQTTFNTFESLLRQRADERIEKPLYTARAVRKGIEEAYHQIEYIINANAAVSTSTDFATFIDRLNPEIDRLNAEFHRALKDLSEGDHTVIEPIATQKYTEEPITVIPKVHYRDGDKLTVKLWLGKDFDVTYKNNINVGMAELTIYGKGDYKGQVTTTFNIAR